MQSIESVLNRPLASALLTVRGSMGGNWIKDRIQQGSATAADSVRIRQHAQDITELKQQTIRRAEFEASLQAMQRSLDRIERKLEK